MWSNNKKGVSNAVLVIIIIMGIGLIVGAIGITMTQEKKVNPYKEEKESESMISKTIDSVPIPNGFYYVGGTKITGLIISDNESDKDRGENHEVAKTLSGNQYVWIPVENIVDFKRQLSNSFNVPNVKTNIANTFVTEHGISLWEIVVDDSTGKITQAYTDKTLKEAKAMYKSVEKYKGFYIARFEAGLVSPRVKIKDEITGTEDYPKLTGTDIIIKAGSYPCNYIQWSDSYEQNIETGGVVDLARMIYPDTNNQVGVISTLVYGVQWDAINRFCSNAHKGNFGNFKNAEFPFVGKYLTNENENEYILDNISSDKEKETSTLYTSCSTSYTKINNIYDLAGSLSEWTMEGMTMITDDIIGYGRIVRGGSFKQDAVSLSHREHKTQKYYGIDIGFRVALYLK